MDLAALQIFKAVVDEGGVIRAARKLNRVQSNVTTRVKQLESDLGAQLFERRGRVLVLSPEGRLLLGYAERMLKLSAEARAAMQSGAPHGTLKLGSLESTAAARLPPILSRYHAKYPDVLIELSTGTSAALVAKVHNFEVEGALVAEPFNAAGLDATLAFTEKLVLVAPKGHKGVRALKNSSRRTLIAFTTGCSYRRKLETWLGMSGIAADRIMEFGSYHAIVACVAAGSGVAIIPRSVLQVLNAEASVAIHALPPAIAASRTMLITRPGFRTAALEALLVEIARKAT